MPRAQGTVASFDSTSGAGTVLLDDGVRLTFSGDAMAGSRVRHLRPGQRVTLDLADPEVPDGSPASAGHPAAEATPHVERVRIVTLP